MLSKFAFLPGDLIERKGPSAVTGEKEKYMCCAIDKDGMCKIAPADHISRYNRFDKDWFHCAAFDKIDRDRSRSPPTQPPSLPPRLAITDAAYHTEPVHKVHFRGIPYQASTKEIRDTAIKHQMICGHHACNT